MRNIYLKVIDRFKTKTNDIFAIQLKETKQIQ